MTASQRNKIRFNEVRVMRVSEDVVQQITEAIADGRLLPGAKLPSQRELRAMFGAGRGAILEALRVLEAGGLVSVRRGSQGGTFVNELPTNTLADALLVMVRVNQVSPDELVDFREMVETHNAATAAARASTDLVQQLTMAVNELARLAERAEDDWEAFIVAEMRCHTLLTKATNNRLTHAFMTALTSATLDAFLLIPSTYHDRIVSDWRELLAAIERKDALGAAKLMGDHIRWFAAAIDVQRNVRETVRPRGSS